VGSVACEPNAAGLRALPHVLIVEWVAEEVGGGDDDPVDRGSLEVWWEQRVAAGAGPVDSLRYLRSPVRHDRIQRRRPFLPAALVVPGSS